jgi:hypothetical protein
MSTRTPRQHSECSPYVSLTLLPRHPNDFAIAWLIQSRRQAAEKITSKNAPTIRLKEIATTLDPLDMSTNAKLEVLASSLRRRPERLDLSSQLSSPLTSPTREYPPNSN